MNLPLAGVVIAVDVASACVYTVRSTDCPRIIFVNGVFCWINEKQTA